MALLPSFLSGSDEAEEAAAKNAALYQGYGVDTTRLLDQYKNQATGALTGANTTALGTLGSGLDNTLATLNQGLSAAAGAGQSAIGAYAPLSNLGGYYGQAVDQYYNALGINGPQAAKQAQRQYVAAPGQQYQIDESTKAAINAASRTGNVAGGSTAQAISDRAGNIVNTNYNQYLDRLAGFVNPQLQATAGAASGIAGANKTLADIYSSGYGGIANAYGTNATQTAGLQSGLGSDISNVWGNYTAGQGQSLKDIVGGNAQANLNIANQGATDASNLWGALGAGVKAVGSAFGGKPA